jgi:ABC-type taurine transport system substrate-binding protein
LIKEDFATDNTLPRIAKKHDKCSPKAFNVMVKNPAIKKIADLKGKTVAGQKGSALNHLLFVALKKEGLTPADIKYVNMAGPRLWPH